MINQIHVKSSINPGISAQDVLNICKSMFSKNRIKYFSYMRMYDDGRAHIFSSNSEVIEYLFANKYKVVAHIPNSLLRQKFNYLIPEKGEYQQAMQRFNVSKALDMFDFGKDYVDFFCYCGTPGDEQITNFYLNNLELLYKFNMNFLDKVSPLLRRNLNKIILSQDMRMNFDSKALNNVNSPNAINLTKREGDVIRLLCLGKSAKEIALSLHLSKRTVESHLENIKIKMDVRNVKSLIVKITGQFNQWHLP